MKNDQKVVTHRAGRCVRPSTSFSLSSFLLRFFLLVFLFIYIKDTRRHVRARGENS